MEKSFTTLAAKSARKMIKRSLPKFHMNDKCEMGSELMGCREQAYHKAERHAESSVIKQMSLKIVFDFKKQINLSISNAILSI